MITEGIYYKQGSKIPSHRYFYEVLDGLLLLSKHEIKLPTENTPLSSRMADDPKYAPYFENCVGVLDGTHIPVCVPAGIQAPYCNCKSFLFTNVVHPT